MNLKLYFFFEASMKSPEAEKKDDPCLHVPMQLQSTSSLCFSVGKEPEATSILQDSAS